MINKQFELTLDSGMHARPAGLFVKSIGPLNAAVTLVAENKTINGKSIMAIMSAGLKYGTLIDITCDGPEEEKVMSVIEALFAANFNE